MKLLFSCQSVVEVDGSNYYSNPVLAAYNRYKIISEDMTVLCFKKDVVAGKSDSINISSLRFIFVKKINTIMSLFNYFFNLNESIIKELVRQSDCCIINLPSFYGYSVVKYAKKYKKPYMTVLTGSAWDAYWNYGLFGKLIAPYAHYKMRRAQSIAPFSIYVTNHFLQNKYPTIGKKLGCSDVDIETGIASVIEKRIAEIRSLKDHNRPLRIGTAGAVNVPYKGHYYVIRALSRLKKKGMLFEYHLLGKGDETNLKNFARSEGVLDLLSFHGQIPHKEVMAFYDNIDIYCQPSLTEGLPRSVVEAMSRGCLCIGSVAGGIPELLPDDYLFEKGDVNRIYSLLHSMTPHILEEQAYRNFNKAKEYDLQTIEKERMLFLSEFKNSVIAKI